MNHVLLFCVGVELNTSIGIPSEWCSVFLFTSISCLFETSLALPDRFHQSGLVLKHLLFTSI